METRSAAGELLYEVGSFVGIEGLEFNEEGVCALQLEETQIFLVRHDALSDRLVLLLEIARPERISADLFGSILAFNFMRVGAPGPWICLDDDTGALFLADDFPLGTTLAGPFSERLAVFFEQYHALRGRFSSEAIADLLPEPEDASASGNPPVYA